MASSPYPFVVAMSKEMLEKWDKYWCEGSALLSIACVLVPRCKLAVFEYYYKMIHPEDYTTFIDNLKLKLKALFSCYEDANSSSVQNQAGSSSTGQHTSSDTRVGLKTFLSGMRTVNPMKSDLEEYLGAPLDVASVDSKFDILSWWKLMAPKYPPLAKLARDILAVPISTVASESTFSIAGKTLSQIRRSLSDESLQALICAQDWLRASVSENGGVFEDLPWSSDEPPKEHDDTICGTFGGAT